MKTEKTVQSKSIGKEEAIVKRDFQTKIIRYTHHQSEKELKRLRTLIEGWLGKENYLGEQLSEEK